MNAHSSTGRECRLCADSTDSNLEEHLKAIHRVDPETYYLAVGNESGRATELIRVQMERGRRLLRWASVLSLSVHKYLAWRDSTRMLLSRYAPNDIIEAFDSCSMPGFGRPLIDWLLKPSRHRIELSRQLRMLEELLPLLSLPEDRQRAVRRTGSKRVFVVHGHDDGLLQSVARFLESLALNVTVLKDEANEGLTVIEKFEKHSDATLAVVLVSPDDTVLEHRTNTTRFRARQNVILELGYFVGKLGRGRVCLLHKGDVEIPTDISGVLYISVDAAGAWRVSLAREIAAAGIPFDMDNLLH